MKAERAGLLQDGPKFHRHLAYTCRRRMQRSLAWEKQKVSHEFRFEVVGETEEKVSGSF